MRAELEVAGESILEDGRQMADYEAPAPSVAFLARVSLDMIWVRNSKFAFKHQHAFTCDILSFTGHERTSPEIANMHCG
ncbi:hypothetical protein WG66_016169 [Moniliophthora roreri]|nr:hypothetical protein WG66_016169 [Moniliophthora roreri]